MLLIENIETGEVRQLTAGLAPAWSPDGSRLAFLSNRSGSPEVWLIHADGSGLRQLTADRKSKVEFVLWTPILPTVD